MAKPIHIKFLFVLVLTISANVAIGQVVAPPKITFGVKTGTTFSTSAFGDKDDKDNFTNTWKSGFFAGGLVNFPLKKNYSFQTELHFSQRGRKIEFNEGTWVNNATYRYLDGMMLLRKSYPLKWTKNIKGTWFFNVGPRISYWMQGQGKVATLVETEDPVTGAIIKQEGGSYKYDVSFSNPPEQPDGLDYQTMYMTNVNRWLFGLDFGIGVDAPTVALQRFVFEVRFSSGHTYFGEKASAFNRTLGFQDNLRANEKIISLSIDYTLTRDVGQGKKGKSTKKESNRSTPRRKFDSSIR